MRNEHPVRAIVEKHREGLPVGIYSVCSANAQVLAAAFEQAAEDQSPLLIEATCNQVNQSGGYTGMQPGQFAAYCRDSARRAGFPLGYLILGGDHLGPSVWAHEKGEPAMEKACELVQAYVEAGFTKIHLDASMSCLDDPSPLPEEVVADRAARLCAVAESSVQPGGNPVYVIGTEVPIPGGAQEDLLHLVPTTPEAVENTIETARRAFAARSLEPGWERVVALVVQPGVEFGSDAVVDYDPLKAKGLSQSIQAYPSMVFEAHSTDFQTAESLRSLVRDHFCILKVGPWLTFAFREAVFALSMIEDELLQTEESLQPSRIRQACEQAMEDQPGHWSKHYRGSDSEQRLQRRYSLSDRIRYYWSEPGVQAALHRLLRNLDSIDLPLSLLSQFLPEGYNAVRRGEISKTPESLIRHRIREVLIQYSQACGLRAAAD